MPKLKKRALLLLAALAMLAVSLYGCTGDTPLTPSAAVSYTHLTLPTIGG